VQLCPAALRQPRRANGTSAWLHTLRSWDGNFADFGPDFWDLDATGTVSDIQPRTTFSNYVGVAQSYPDAHPGSNPGLVRGGQ